MVRVLVTGASGFIGTHLCNKLSEYGHTVIALEHETEVTAEVSVVVKGDVGSYPSLQRAMDFEPQAIIHLAAQPIVTDAEENPIETFQTNTMGLVNLAYAASRLRSLGAFIVASTDKVYGRHEALPYKEDFELRGLSQVYEASKTCADLLTTTALASFNVPVAVTRFGNVYGPGDMHYSRLIPHTIMSFMDDMAPQIRSNGQLYRDYVYVDDVVDGYVKLLDYELSKRTISHDIFNFGTGQPARVLDIVYTLSEFFPQTSHQPVVHYGAQGEISKQYLDSTKAEQVLGWKPKTKLRDGLLKTVDWFKETYGN